MRAAILSSVMHAPTMGTINALPWRAHSTCQDSTELAPIGKQQTIAIVQIAKSTHTTHSIIWLDRATI
jgi:hypothetical protein